MWNINIDITDIQQMNSDLTQVLKRVTEQAAKDLSTMTHTKAVELAQERLHSRRKMFIDALSMREEDGVLILSLDAKAAWIDDGLPKHNMLDALLASPKAKRAKDGSRYLVVPFQHSGKGPASATPQQVELTQSIKDGMKARKIPWSKIERDDQGRPKVGRLHSFNLGGPLKTHNGPGQGWGPVGDHKQGPNERQKVGGGPGGGGTPFLHGVSVYQHVDSSGKATRSVMTFRIASSKHQAPHWDHPGLEATNIFADVAQWCQEQVDLMVVPRVLAALQDAL